MALEISEAWDRLVEASIATEDELGLVTSIRRGARII